MKELFNLIMNIIITIVLIRANYLFLKVGETAYIESTWLMVSALVMIVSKKD